ncbi:uncharacterized protein LOC129232694 [Uloborus diversus]|uniref:uncharacterized protein LOC129232694 n=2 Tax=Uloborus diversus TaxID=327109 RepID=UPI002409E5EB|nr:uncharacterized protein LOC129232694 [Uloborus diversus]
MGKILFEFYLLYFYLVKPPKMISHFPLSLFSKVNKYCPYPVGHPTIITEGFDDIDQYFGIVKCRVVPPRGLYLPVLPCRIQDKLMFPLCRTCAENTQQDPCAHCDDDRALTGTWVSEELKLAKKKGYQITDMYEVYHFPISSNVLFRDYIDLFLKIKQESSGWPRECSTEDEKREYILRYEAKEGILLDSNAISKNPGRRQVAKLALNSFWGRFGMNTNKTSLVFVNSIPTFNKYMADSTKIIKDVFFPSDELAALQFVSAAEFVKQDTSTNIFVAAFTTAWARLKLYEEMDKLGTHVLYHDTDSIIYSSDGTNDPPLGNFLGDFTDELDGGTISVFVSGGPKNYAYTTSDGETCCKVRGFTLNHRNVQLLNFDSIKQLVLNLDEPSSINIHNPAKICREPKRRKIMNKVENKMYQIIYNKRVIQPDYSTLPYGY